MTFGYHEYSGTAHYSQTDTNKQQRQQQLYQYRCSNCNNLLKETQSPLDNSILNSIRNERCDSCGICLDRKNIEVKYSDTCSPPFTKQLQQQGERQQEFSSIADATLPTPLPTTELSTAMPAIKLERAFDLRTPKFTFGIPQIDSLFDPLDKGAICITSDSSEGGRRLANTLVTRACVHALMSRRQGDTAGSGGGFESPSVIIIDAGNCSDVYQCVNFARQYGMDVKKVLDSIIVSRPFTIHQLAGLIIDNLESVIKQFNAKLVVLTDILSMFIKDPQIDTEEAEWIIKEIVRALKKLSLSVVLLIVVSVPGQAAAMQKQRPIIPSYASTLIRIFQICIDLYPNVASAQQHQRKQRHQHQLGNIEVQVNDQCNNNRVTKTAKLCEKDLQLVPSR